MDDFEFDESLIGEAPCEFCGELYPLMLLIEHQTTHLADAENYAYLDEFLNTGQAKNIIQEEVAELKSEPEVAVEQKQKSSPEFVEMSSKRKGATSPGRSIKNKRKVDEDVKLKVKFIKESEDSKKVNSIASGFQLLDSRILTILKNNNTSLSLINKEKLILQQKIEVNAEKGSDAKNETELSSISTKEQTESSLIKNTTEVPVESTITRQIQNFTLKDELKGHKKFQTQNIKEFTSESGEKLLVYGSDMDPEKDIESEKQMYKMPNNPLFSSVCKEEDVEDINNLSDDDCDESLEEFWKRARDFLKRKRVKSEC